MELLNYINSKINKNISNILKYDNCRTVSNFICFSDFDINNTDEKYKITGTVIHVIDPSLGIPILYMYDGTKFIRIN